MSRRSRLLSIVRLADEGAPHENASLLASLCSATVAAGTAGSTEHSSFPIPPTSKLTQISTAAATRACHLIPLLPPAAAFFTTHSYPVVKTFYLVCKSLLKEVQRYIQYRHFVVTTSRLLFKLLHHWRNCFW